MARLMSSTELHERITSDEPLSLLDVRESEDYEDEHIPDALNIPLSALASSAPEELKKNERVVVYGLDHDDESSNNASEVLENMGFRKVSDFDGGLIAWKKAGFETKGENIRPMKTLTDEHTDDQQKAS